MTEYTKADYLAACEALYDGKPTEYKATKSNDFREWEYTTIPSPERAKETQWRPVDPLREYREAFEAGKRVEWMIDRYTTITGWMPVNENFTKWNEDGIKYRIVEEAKTIKLYPFAKCVCDVWVHAGFFATIEDAKKIHLPHVKIAQIINSDGSIEVNA